MFEMSPLPRNDPQVVAIACCLMQHKIINEMEGIVLMEHVSARAAPHDRHFIKCWIDCDNSNSSVSYDRYALYEHNVKDIEKMSTKYRSMIEKALNILILDVKSVVGHPTPSYYRGMIIDKETFLRDFKHAVLSKD